VIVTTTGQPRIPLATYRLQFNARFTFRDARAIVDYLHALGISDCYASSYLAAVPGSMHGYDVADPTRLNPEVGTEEEYSEWVDALAASSMGHILDLVPNHMGIACSANAWWLDVLENGPSSRYARFFDIEWHPVKDELEDKVLFPILGDQYGAVLERQELTLRYREGAFFIEYGRHRLPVAPDTYPQILLNGFDAWCRDDGDGVPEEDTDELRSIATAAGNLPARTARDPDEIALRAREKEVVKRRLAALLERSVPLRRFVDQTVERFNGTAGEPATFDLLDQLLGAQSYRVAHWRVASEEINYRRFFDVNELAALRMEDPVVFDEVHRFALELVARRAAHGLRVDHVDGLFSPATYLRRLQQRAAEALGTGPADRPLFVVVEKILGADEQLPSDWPVHGTTGYEFSATLNNLFVEARHERSLDEIYVRFTRQRHNRPSFGDIAYRSKKQVMHATMSGDLNWLGHQLNRFAERNRHFRDFTLYNLISTLKEVIACFPVYRTYITADDPVREQDRRYIVRTIHAAKQRAPGGTSLVFDFVQRLLLKETPIAAPEDAEERARFIGKFQQITSPVAAKGVEDTALYVYNRLLSLNEVGADPTRFGLDPATVHRWMADRRARWPAALSVTSTHDTKRGEDVRARLNVLSEMPAAWKAAVGKWRTLNRRFKVEIEGIPAPDPNEEYFLYQTLVGAWPFDPSTEDTFRERLKAYLVKSLREAKVNSGWLSPDEAYEEAVFKFVDAILDRRRPFLQAFLPFQRQVAELGIYNSLAQLLVKITAPGIPDFYQGTELWDLSLVDPDNRRPVDYARRRQLLDEIERCQDPALVEMLLEKRVDGRVKLLVIARALKTRNERAHAFQAGSYVALQTTGARGQCLFAFARRHQDTMAITCVPRLVATLAGDTGHPPVGRAVWGDTRIQLPGATEAGAPMPRAFRDAITGTRLPVETHRDAAHLEAAAVLDRFPVALLVSTPG
jgi:(1->4)-alpha-D-glucan 1-alpha-D-glucosylmutase